LYSEKNKTELSQAEKFWSSFFKSSRGLKGRRPSSTSAEVETPRISEKVPLFGTLHLLVNALLAKGEKEEINSLKCERGCRISEIFP